MALFAPLISKLRGASGPARVTGNKGTTRNRASGGNGAGASFGRAGPPHLPANNAVSTVFQFDESHTVGTYTKVLSTDDDWVGFNFTITVTPTGCTVSDVDILAAISQMQVLGPEGPVMTLQPGPDFYYLQQRFNPYHTFVAQTLTSGATAEVYSADVPVSLPQAQGPYTLVWSVAAASAIGGSTSAITAEVALSCTAGTASGQLNYLYAGFPATVATSGTQDLAPIAAIQGVTLVELFISSLSTNTTDIATLQLQSAGSTVGPRITGYNLVSMAQSRLGQTLAAPTDGSAGFGGTYGQLLMPLFAMQTTLQLGRSAHAIFYFGSASISTAPRIGYAWLA